MSLRVGTPVNQKRLTNVSVVRLMKGGKRFEIACYCNKVESFRNGIETDMTEVLQSEFVFTNVSKGNFANSKDLIKAFGTDDIMTVCKVILADGELQLTAKERQAHTESTFRDIATIISEKCVNPTNSRPYTVSTILSALRDDLKYGLVPGRSAKQQALDLIKRLQTVIPIARARMHVRIHDTKVNEELHTALKDLDAQKGEGMDYFIEPDLFKEFSSCVAKYKGRVEVVQLSVVSDTTPIETKPAETTSTNKADRKAAVEDDEDSTNQLVHQQHEPKSNDQSGSRKSKGAKRREKEEAAEKQQAKQEAKRREESRANKLHEVTEKLNDVSLESLPQPPPVNKAESSETSEAKSCTTCGGNFKSAEDHRAHFKSNWHRFNLKLKMANQPVVSEEEFNAVDAEDFF
jgi:ribosome maturation protein SDO1